MVATTLQPADGVIHPPEDGTRRMLQLPATASNWLKQLPCEGEESLTLCKAASEPC